MSFRMTLNELNLSDLISEIFNDTKLRAVSPRQCFHTACTRRSRGPLGGPRRNVAIAFDMEKRNGVATRQ